MDETIVPPPPRDLPPQRAAAIKEALMEHVTTIDRPVSKNRRRKALMLLPAAAMLTAAAGYILLRGDQVASSAIGCYDAPSSGANVAVVAADGGDPVATCRALWEKGHIKEGQTLSPGLTACVGKQGAVAVLPAGPSICSELGMQDLPDDYVEASQRFVAMRDDAVERWYRAARADGSSETEACMDEATATGVARAVLDDHGYTDWTVVTATGDYRGRRCFNFHSFESRDRRVLIIPSDPGIHLGVYGAH